METKNKKGPHYESYTDNLRTVVKGKQYAGKNVLTTDGKMGYITETGVIKQYSSPNSLNVLNGCTTSYEQLNNEWDKLGFPIGSAMVDGQTCGNETKYIQSKPPSVNFDWKYYINSHPDLNLTTEQQAIDHWNNTGIHEGLLPNATILSEMSNVGKIGYVDVNTTLHTVPSDAYKYTGKYNEFKDLNVTGTNMEDCSRTIPVVKYGEQVFMKFGDIYGSMNNSSILEFNNVKTPFFLRPIPYTANAYYMNGTPIKYGDQICIAVTSQNWWGYFCGFWGCKVGYINPHTNIIGFGPGGVYGGSYFTITPPIGSQYTVGSEIKYNDSFILTASLSEPANLKQDVVVTPGNYIWSGNGKYLFVYQTDGNICFYDLSSGYFKLIWMSGKVHVPQKMVLQGDGNLVAYDTNGIPQWTSNSHQTSNESLTTYQLNVQNDRNLTIVSSDGATIWSTNTSIGLDIEGGNITKIGHVSKEKLIRFGTPAESVGKCEFTFSNINHDYAYDLSCDMNALNTACNADNTCTGFIYSSTDNTWQKIPTNSNAELYKITDTPPKIFVKETDIDMKDKSCLSGKSQFVESTIYSNYPKGNDYAMNGNQCNLKSVGISFPTPIEQKKQKYDKMNKKYSNQQLHIVNEYPMNEQNVQQNNALYKQMSTKTTEYKNLLKQINTEKNKNIITYQQMNEDLHGIESLNKSNALVWGVSSIVLIGIVVALRHNIKN